MGNGCLNNSKETPLKKADVQYLMHHTTFNEQQIRQWHKAFLRDCPDGNLSRLQFLVIYQALFPQGKAGPFYNHVFRTFDQDGSGKIDFREFLCAINITQEGNPRDRLELAFRLYDVDGSGSVERSELVEIVKGVYLMMESDMDQEELSVLAERKAAEIFSRVDVNKDGSLSQEEFIEVCLKDPCMFRLLANGDSRRK